MTTRNSITTVDTTDSSPTSSRDGDVRVRPTMSETAALSMDIGESLERFSFDEDDNYAKEYDPAAKHDDPAPPKNLRVSFGTNEVRDDNTCDSNYSDGEAATKPNGIACEEEPARTSMRQRKSAFQQKALGHVSKMYDLDNKGYLTEEEQLMREMDVDGKGYLTKEQVYEIVRQKLEEEHDVKQYKMAAIWMMGFMVLLTLTGFGTSYTSAILNKEINADVESGAVLVKNTDTVIGVDGISDTLNFSELSDEEYSERRARVLKEMNDEEFMGMHQHRRLANKKHGYTIVFDQGKVRERDLEKIVERCDKGNVVNIQRTWKNPDGSYDKDFDTICGPAFTVVNKKGAKNKGKNRSKVRTTMEHVVFRKGPRKNANDEGDTVSFFCEKGWW